MVQIILLGIVIVMITVVIHAVGTVLCGHVLLKKLARRRGHLKSGYMLFIVSTTFIVLLLFLFTETAAWSCLYFMVSDAIGFKSFEDALYFSIVTFTTVGYGDITLQGSWRILAGIEAMNGVLLVGWSSASLFAVIRQLWTYEIQQIRESQKGSPG